MKENQKINLFDRIMMAITFAEADEAETAREILERRDTNRPGAGLEKRPGSRPTLRM
ncbi:hypothetical protein ACUUL3_16165 [Thiovibrio sp. JS02]